MKANEYLNWNRNQNPQADGTFGPSRAALTLVEQTKSAILAAHDSNDSDCKHLVQLALNEAEALASQTDYPYLFFPNLAAEKLQAVGNWWKRQRLMHEASAQLALAA